jgi:hypothetical protein
MNSSIVKTKRADVQLVDKRSISVPLDWFEAFYGFKSHQPRIWGFFA